MSRRRIGAIALVPVLAVATILAIGLAPGASHTDAHGATATRQAFHDAMRKLWEDHIVWTRQFIVSAATQTDPLPDLGPTRDRLLANQAHIGDAIKPFYGDEAGDALTALLREHIVGAADLIAAAKSGDADEIKLASDAWYANADEIAAFLSEANPRNWPLEMLEAHMRSHLDLTLEEALARLEGRYPADIEAYDKVHADIL